MAVRCFKDLLVIVVIAVACAENATDDGESQTVDGMPRIGESSKKASTKPFNQRAALFQPLSELVWAEQLRPTSCASTSEMMSISPSSRGASWAAE